MCVSVRASAQMPCRCLLSVSVLRYILKMLSNTHVWVLTPFSICLLSLPIPLKGHHVVQAGPKLSM